MFHVRSAALGLAALSEIVLFFFPILPIPAIAPVVLALIFLTKKSAGAPGMVDRRLFSLFVFMAFATCGALILYRLDPEGPPLLLASFGLSQVVSNVPAAFLLPGKADRGALAIGVNIGGGGTLVSSMATAIACRYIKRYDSRTTV